MAFRVASWVFLFLSPPSARRATTFLGTVQVDLQISIPALREEGDGRVLTLIQFRFDFYPRPPRGGRLHTTPAYLMGWKISIPALREEGDCLTSLLGQPPQHFYPRPPRGGRRVFPAVIVDKRYDFYPRPPRGGRHTGPDALLNLGEFLSPPSARRATVTLVFFVP